MSKEIIAGLLKLDVEDDAMWTADGLPKVDTLETITGLNLSRAEITAAAPQFTRTNVVIPEEEETPAEIVPSTIVDTEDNSDNIEFQTPWAQGVNQAQAIEKANSEASTVIEADLKEAEEHLEDLQKQREKLNLAINEHIEKVDKLLNMFKPKELTLKQQLDLVHKQNHKEAVEKQKKREAIEAIMGDDKSLLVGLNLK